MTCRFVHVFIVLIFTIIGAACSSNLAVPPSFVGPDATEHLIGDVDRAWAPWKRELQVNHRLSFGFDYAATFLSANDVSANDTAAGGIARAYGIIGLIETGALVFKVDHRHAFGSPAPGNFALGELGYAGIIARPFTDEEFGTQNFYWRQRLNGGRSTLIAGILDPTDYVDAFALSSPWTHFLNAAFSTGSSTIGLPNDAAFGVAYGSMIGRNVYLLASLTDINGDPTEPFKGIDNFFTDNEYFASVELGWTTARKNVLFDSAHVTVWHKDKQSATQVDGGWGLSFSFSRYVTENLMPFVRGGYADDAGTLLQKSLSIGLGHQTTAFNGFVGAGLNWGDPNESTFGVGLQDQWAVEIFYRVPIGRRFAVTGDVQYIKDPAVNPTQNTIWMLNLRARAAF
jgi:porin